MKREIKLSPTILTYENDPYSNFDKIHDIIDAGVNYLHMDVMRDDFIYARNVFDEKMLKVIYKEFGDKVNFDYHLMVSDTYPMIDFITRQVLGNGSNGDVSITVHREAFTGSITKDRFNEIVKNAEKFEEWEAILNHSDENVLKSLKIIKDLGYRTGIALEPQTDIEHVKDDMLEYVDMLLLMAVNTGYSGQYYTKGMTEKIRRAAAMYSGKEIQVDGGINFDNIHDVMDAGATNIAVGSSITLADDPTAATKKLLEITNGKSYTE